MSSKDAVRTAMRAARSAISPERRRALSREAARHLMADPIWQNARAIALYMDVRGELGTADLLEAAVNAGKTVLLPVCGEPGHMDLALYTGRLRTGAYGIPEPECPDDGREARTDTCFSDAVPDLIVVPGMAFDREGFRLGMGAGYYDRFLARDGYAGVTRIGFAYALQVVDRLPREAWDLPVHALCTEEGLVWI